MGGRKNYVINGRGPQGVAVIGFLKIMEQKGHAEKINKIAGNSVGAMLGLLFAIGWTTEQLEDLAGNLAQFLDKSANPIRNFDRLLHKYGYFKGKRLHEWAQKQIKDVFGNPNATFKDLHAKVKEIRKRGEGKRKLGEPRCDIYMQVSNLTDEEGILLSHKNFGETPLADALCATTRIIAGYPWINVKIGDDGEFVKNPDGSLRRFKPDDPGVISLADGGVTKNNPIDFADYGFKNDDTIGIFLHKNPGIKKPQRNIISNALVGSILYSTSTLRKFSAAVGKTINTLRNAQNSPSDEDRIVHIKPTDGVGLFSFDLKPPQIKEMIEHGEVAGKEFFVPGWDKPPESSIQQRLETTCRMERELLCRESYQVFFSTFTDEFVSFQFYFKDHDRANEIAQGLTHHKGVRDVSLGVYKKDAVVSFDVKAKYVGSFNDLIKNDPDVEIVENRVDTFFQKEFKQGRQTNTQEKQKFDLARHVSVPEALLERWQLLWSKHLPSDDYLTMVTDLLYSETRGLYDVRFVGCCCRREKNSAERLMKYLKKPEWGNHFKNPNNLIKVFEEELQFSTLAGAELDNQKYFALLTFLVDTLKKEVVSYTIIPPRLCMA